MASYVYAPELWKRLGTQIILKIMKYIVFDITSKLQNSIVGQAFVTSNPLKVCKEGNRFCTVIYKTSENVQEQATKARVSNGKMYLTNGSVIPVSVIPEGIKFVAFEPDSNFKTLRTGHCKQIPFSKIKEEGLRDTSFFLGCKKDGPKSWTFATFIDGHLDFGTDVTEAEALVEGIDEKK